MVVKFAMLRAPARKAAGDNFLTLEQNRNKILELARLWRFCMSLPQQQWYRLVSRGGAGLACDEDGVSLGVVALARARTDAQRIRRCEVRPADEVGHVLSAAYGPQPDAIVLRFHRGLRRAAASIEAGDLCRAGIEAVLLGLPDLTPDAMAKLNEIADLEKGGAAWENEPRIPAGQAGGGQWTADGGGAPRLNVRPSRNVPTDGARREQPEPALDEGVYRPGVDRPFATPRGNAAAEGASGERVALPLDDGVYRPDVDHPFVLPVAGGVEEDEKPRDSNEPPAYAHLLEAFPGLARVPWAKIPVAVADLVFAVGEAAEMTNEPLADKTYHDLLADIKEVDPSAVLLLPSGGVAGLSFQGRNDLINSLRMQLADSIYKGRGDARPLQIETLRFLQNAVDDAYVEGVNRFDAGRLTPRLSRGEAIGNFLDRLVRQQLREYFDNYQIRYGPGEDVTINNRNYNTSDETNIIYKIPDARIGNLSFDWTLELKTPSSPQIRGFFSADSQPWGVVIVRPSPLGQNSSYLILRPPPPPP